MTEGTAGEGTAHEGAEHGGTGPEVTAHGGTLAAAAARANGADTMFTLSGGHVFPLYDAAVHMDPPMRLLDVRHEQTAVFAAEATARLTRRPGLAVLTAGPGVTNGVSAITTAQFNGSPVVILGGRAPDGRWGSGSLQEFDHPELLRPITKAAWTEHETAKVGAGVDEAFRLATAPHRGPVFVDIALEALFGPAPHEPGLAGGSGPADSFGPGGTRVRAARPGPSGPATTGPDSPGPADPGLADPAAPGDPEAAAAIARLIAAAQRPVLVLGSDVWMGGAEQAARAAAEELRLPVVTNGQGRGILPRGHELLVTRARSAAFREADLVVVVGTPLDFRLGYGVFGDQNDPQRKPAVVHVADAPGQVAAHSPLAACYAGDLGAFFAVLADPAAWPARPARAAWEESWLPRLQDVARQATAADGGLLASEASPIHPMRIYGELAGLLDDDAVVIGDGGDFVSYAGKYIEPGRPGGWLDPGPFGCLGTGLGYAIAARLARPADQVVLLLGDGAAGFSLMDVDTLVRHGLPVVMVCGNNGIWGLEKHPMRAIYGYDVAADLQPQCRYDEVVSALGGAGELVTRPDDIGPALRRAFGSGVPYLVNVITDPTVAYPRATTGI
jgi:acetolactate synthase-1/2/3 large subunit